MQQSLVNICNLILNAKESGENNHTFIPHDIANLQTKCLTFNINKIF